MDDAVAGAVRRGLVPQLVVTVADAAGLVRTACSGPRTVGDATHPPQGTAGPDSLFRIASMTKIVTTVAALQLVERGRLDLDAPVAAYLPEFGDLRVLAGFDGDVPVLRPPRTTATVRRLAVHTAGLGYWFWNAGLARWEQVTGAPNVLSGRREALRAPLVADPGSRFEYGTGTDWLGLVVERASGQPLDAYVEEHVTGPLGMASTTFHPDAAQRGRLVPVHRRDGDDGAWRATRLDWPRRPDWWSGGHGLYSTPRDQALLHRALLRDGAVDGVRILSPESVEQIFTPQIGPLDFPARIATADPRSSADVALGPGLTWGLGLLLTRRARPGAGVAAGSGGWAGIFNTFFLVDRRTGIAAAVYAQTLPFLAPGPALAVTQVGQAVYAGPVDG